ncbi:MAG TPA: hypothetical protein VFK05_20805 [Polyangiaceae bacterium]|nr:hypothetical protein [Polyangiaceae bacterium]
MSLLSLTCCGLLSAVCAFTLVSATGCGTEAQGINECRQIEQARCEAAHSCGLISDVAACQRYYRDQCLHGLPVSPPTSTQLKECVATIQAAGVCATQAEDPNKALLRECDPRVTQGALVLTACGLVQEPEKSVECSFLSPGADGGLGGASNSGGGEGGQSESAAGEGGNQSGG